MVELKRFDPMDQFPGLSPVRNQIEPAPADMGILRETQNSEGEGVDALETVKEQPGTDSL